MPQLNKGGKFVFGLSVIHEDGSVRIPPQAMREYRMDEENEVILFTGSKSTGGFCVTRRGLLLPSALGHILTETPALTDGTLAPGEFVRYKGRSYCRLPRSGEGTLVLPARTMQFLQLAPGLELLSIRSSDVAFTMGAKGPLLDKAASYEGEIPTY